uniref:Myb/SANT-like DNA-binding domain-containing protein n=1 Tax=Ciona savignyi TaxID=51511 RepID=H2Y7T9_CIOSA
IDKYKNIIECKKTDARVDKESSWGKFCEEFNSTSTYCVRTIPQLKLFWKNSKLRAKRNSSLVRRQRVQTGGGPPTEPDEFAEKIEALIPSQIKPLQNPYDDDATLDL